MMKSLTRLVLVPALCLTAGCVADMKTAELAVRNGDYATARAHYEVLSDFGIPDAQVELAKLESRGLGAPENNARALTLLDQASGSGDPEVLYEMGRLYQDGKGVPRDIEKARGFYGQAIDRGYVRAYYQMALLSEEEKDYQAADSLYRQALAGGYYKAATRIGKLYQNGKGRPADPEMALSWYYAARSHQVPDMDDDIGKLESKLGQEQIDSARLQAERLF